MNKYVTKGRRKFKRKEILRQSFEVTKPSKECIPIGPTPPRFYLKKTHGTAKTTAEKSCSSSALEET